jgi:hypothetical protein
MKSKSYYDSKSSYSSSSSSSTANKQNSINRNNFKSSTSVLNAASMQSALMSKYNLPGAKELEKVEHQKQDMKINQSKGCNTLESIIYCLACGSQNIDNLSNTTNNNYCNIITCQICNTYLYPDKCTKEEDSYLSSFVAPMNWKDIEQKVYLRKDITCPICIMPFIHHSEILLSCTHIFHSPCLQSFEKFTQKNKKTRFCPLCREPHYFAKKSHIGSINYQNYNIIKLQSLYRGYITRKVYYYQLKSFYQAGFGLHTKTRKKFYEKELTQHADRYVQQAEEYKTEVDDIVR